MKSKLLNEELVKNTSSSNSYMTEEPSLKLSRRASYASSKHRTKVELLKYFIV